MPVVPHYLVTFSCLHIDNLSLTISRKGNCNSLGCLLPFHPFKDGHCDFHFAGL